MIINTPLRPGECLPSEQEIAEAYGVNKLSVRMALQKLSTLGVIEKKNGEGSFVKEFSMSPLLAEVVDFYGSCSMSDIEDMRTLLEGESAEKAAALASDEEKEELKTCLDLYNQKMEEMLMSRTNENFMALIDADMAFHMQIVQMSHNTLFCEVYLMVQNLIRKHMSSLITEREESLKQHEQTQDIHNELYKAICAGNGGKARRVTRAIIDSRSEVGSFIDS